MDKIEALPRYRLATLPTSLDEAPRLSKELGVRVLIKRDDLTGFALGGNKARKLEFLVADALACGADVLVTGGGPQSNHARTTAAAARRLGMDAVLVLTGSQPSEVNGNLLLDQLLAAEIRYTQTDDRAETERILHRVVEELQASGRRPYLIPLGGSTVLGCISYILAVEELLSQLKHIEIEADSVFITTGSCGTHAGILAGMYSHNASIPVVGVTVSRSAEECQKRIESLFARTGEFLDQLWQLRPSDIRLKDGYIGAGYGAPTPEGHAAIRLVAQLEGIFLDPVYTGKTMAGLIDTVRRGEIARGSTVVFWHTGGAPGIFGRSRDFAMER